MFRLALRQTEGLIGSIIGLLGLELHVPDHSTLSRRARTLEVPRPQPRRDGEPGYTTRARAETAIGRFKYVIGDGLRSRTDDRQATEVDITVHARNRMVEFERPSDVRTA